MILRRLTSLLASVCLLMATAVTLVQPVVVAGTHLHFIVDMQAHWAITDLGHAHDVDLPEHNPADHTHDVASESQNLALPLVGWASSWIRGGAATTRSDTQSGLDRPPRDAV